MRQVWQGVILFGFISAFTYLMFRAVTGKSSRRLAEFRRVTLDRALGLLKEDWAEIQTRTAIISDLAELVAWFVEQPRDLVAAKDLIAVILESACQGLLPTETYIRGRFLIWVASDGELAPLVQYSGDGVPPFKGTHFRLGVGTPGESFESGEAVIVDDFAKAHPEIEDAWAYPYKSVVCIPVPTLPEREKRIGVLNFDSPVVGHFSADDARLLRVISNYAYLVYIHAQPTVGNSEQSPA